MRIALSVFKKHPMRHMNANRILAFDAFAFIMPIRKSVKRTRALRSGGTQKIFIRVDLKLPQVTSQRKKIFSL